MIGKTISHFRVLEKVAAGGMGVVYKARDEKLDRNVALKFVSEPLSKDRVAIGRFLREARAVSAKSMSSRVHFLSRWNFWTVNHSSNIRLTTI
jgi:serine/threonine protein kinase